MFGSTRLDDRDIKDLLHLFLSGNSHLPLPFADSLDALQEKLNEYENNCPPILVSLEYPSGLSDGNISGHVFVFIPKHSKSLNITSTGVLRDLMDPAAQH